MTGVSFPNVKFVKILSRNMIAYRICERKNGKLHTLFHALNGTRELPMNEWLTADIKEVCDGSRKTSKMYTSGFHVLRDIDDCRKFVKKFRRERDLVLVECEVTGIRDKAHSTSNVLVTDKIKLTRVVEKLHFT